MAISSEFQNAVKEKNILRIRIMLKDSLLIDRSFSMFKKLLEYTEKHGVKVLMDARDSLERADKPWTVELMNSELTSLVGDFTEEHIQYVKDIIINIYGEVTPEEIPQIPLTVIRRKRDEMREKMERKIKDIRGKKEWSREKSLRFIEVAEKFLEACEDI